MLAMLGAFAVVIGIELPDWFIAGLMGVLMYRSWHEFRNWWHL